MKTKVDLINNTKSDIGICLCSAFKDLQSMIKDVFVYFGMVPNQLSFEEFTSLFGKYDWQDIIDKIEELDNQDFIDHKNSVFNHLSALLNQDKQVKTISNPKENSYYKEWDNS